MAVNVVKLVYASIYNHTLTGAQVLVIEFMHAYIE